MLFSLLIAAILLGTPNHALAGQWTKVSPNTLSFKGEIEDNELEKFSAVFSSDIKKIIVDSEGGRTIVGLRIGQILLNKGVTVEVQGLCMSACANYLFAAGAKRLIRNGVVGFHGNLRAFVKTVNAFIKKSPKQARAAILRVCLEKPDLSDNEIEKIFDQFQAAAQEEDLFFQALGISQDLFDRSERDDKGMGSGTYSMLLPKTLTFEKYGFHGIEGEQSLKFMESDPRVAEQAKQGWPVLLD